jgi:hypothetical protein
MNHIDAMKNAKEALRGMMNQHRNHGLPYGNEAYEKANSALGDLFQAIGKAEALAKEPAPVQVPECDSVTIAGLNSACGHLSALVDELRYLLGRAMDNFKTLHNAATPDNGPDMDAVIPAGVFAAFVNEDAAIRYEIKHSPHDGMLTPPTEPVQPDKYLQLALDALAPLEKLFMQAADRGLLNNANVDCQISTSDLRKSVYAASDIRAYLNSSPTIQPAPVQEAVAIYEAD